MSRVRPMRCSRAWTADFSAWSTCRPLTSGLVLAPSRTPLIDSAGAVADVVVGGSATAVWSELRAFRAKPAATMAAQATTATAKPVREETKSRSRPGTADDMTGRASTAATDYLRVPGARRRFPSGVTWSTSTSGAVLRLFYTPFARDVGFVLRTGGHLTERAPWGSGHCRDTLLRRWTRGAGPSRRLVLPGRSSSSAGCFNVEVTSG